MTKQPIGKWLRIWRKASRMTQSELAAKTGLNQYQISRLEQGEVEKPTMEDLVRLGDAFGVEPNEMARLAGYWVPSARYTSEDQRLAYVLAYLARASDKDRDKYLDEIYDRALFREALSRLEGEAETRPE